MIRDLIRQFSRLSVYVDLRLLNLLPLPEARGDHWGAVVNQERPYESGEQVLSHLCVNASDLLRNEAHVAQDLLLHLVLLGVEVDV